MSFDRRGASTLSASPYSGTTLVGRSYLTSSAVMALLGYKDRGVFWDFVHRGGVPHVRLNARKIMFALPNCAHRNAIAKNNCRSERLSAKWSARPHLPADPLLKSPRPTK